MNGSEEPTRASEALLFALLPESKLPPAARLWCLSPGRGQLAVAAAAADPERRVVLSHLDRHLSEAAREKAGGRDGVPPPNLEFDCQAELPKGPFDAALVPLRAGADSEVAWEILQHAYLELRDGGVLLASTDEPRDHWLAGRMDALFGGHVGRKADDEAIAYRGVRRGPLKKVKTFDCEFAFRDGGRLIRAVSRPGVFSHRRLDLGARALMESLVRVEQNGLERELVEAGMRVLDYGCGAGTVGLAAAMRAPGALVHFVDSMPRAVACALAGAALNGVVGATGEVASDGRISGAGTFDLALLNPPYYSHFRIAEIFVRAARDALKKGGRALIVTKQPEWFVDRLPRDFDRVRQDEARGYAIVSGTKR